MRTIRLVLLVGLTLLGLGLLTTPAGEPAQAQGENLLSNPGFEGSFSSYTPETAREIADCPSGICTTAQVPIGWKAWWLKERPTDVNPEFKPAERNVRGDRVHSGDRAAQYFSFWSTHKAGIRQTVSVPDNAIVEFSVWGHSWMSEDDLSLVSDRSGTPNMRIGIDTTGGTNPYGPEVVWSDPVQAYDVYIRFSIQAQAKGNQVTVFTFSEPSVNPNSPEYGFKHTDMYWDDAALVVVGAGSAPVTSAPSTGETSANPAPVLAPARVYVPGPTPTPNAEGVIMVEILSGEGYWSIAARAGISLDQFFEYNGLSRSDVPQPGDMVIIGYGDPPSESTEIESAEETAAEAEATEPDPTATPAPLPTQVVITIAEEEISGVSICMKAYDDTNQNSMHDSNELLRQNVAFTVSDGQNVVSNYVTDGFSEPFCIEGLEAGGYHVSRSVLGDEQITTADNGNWSIALTNGSSLSLESGSFLTGETLAGEENSAVDNEDGGGLDVLTIVAIVVIVILLGAIVFVFINARR